MEWNFADKMRWLVTQAQETKHREDVESGQKLLEKLPTSIMLHAAQGLRVCVLTFDTISRNIYFNDSYFDLNPDIKFNDINYFITIIRKYCEEDGFKMVVKKQEIVISW